MKIQKWLLPTKANKYHPHLLRPLGLGMIVAALLGINLLQNITSAHHFQVLGVATDISSSEVINLTNQQRANNGLSALGSNAKLAAAAQAKAQDMFAKNYWAHYAPDGTSPWSFISAAGYAYKTAGENLAKDFDTSSGVVNGWMNSPEHRANILSSSFVDTGVAVMNGTLQGEETTLVVAFYAAPQVSAPATAPTSKPPTSTSKPTPAPVTTPVSTTTPTTEPAPEASTHATEPTAPVATSGTVQSKTPTRTIAEQSVSYRESRTWGQNATLFLLSAVFLVSVLKHTVVWRTQKRGWRHIWLRAHPAAQYGLLFVAIIANLASGVGVIR
jgi:hypothetical protein